MTDATAPRRQIYHQGFWDGACLLYALANAYKALTGQKVTRERWDRALEELPEPLTFLTGVGAAALDDEAAVDLIGRMLERLADAEDAFDLHQLSPAATIADLSREISRDAVVLFAFGGTTEVHRPENHVVCGVATSAEHATLYLACSAAFSDQHPSRGRYDERFHPDVDRYSNDAIAFDGDVRVAPHWRWRLSVRPRS